MARDRTEYDRLIKKIKDALIIASKASGEQFAALMAVADLSIEVLLDTSDNDFEKFKAVYEVFMNRIEYNIDEAVKKRLTMRMN